MATESSLLNGQVSQRLIIIPMSIYQMGKFTLLSIVLVIISICNIYQTGAALRRKLFDGKPHGQADCM